MTFNLQCLRQMMDGPQGWSDLFREVSQLMQSSSRQFSTANEEYVEYALERLFTCVKSVNIIKAQVKEEVGEDSSHTLFQIYQLLSNIESRDYQVVQTTDV